MADDDLKRTAGRPRSPVARHELLARAREAFAEQGFAGASMGDIAQRAGLRKSSLFHHFVSKEALYQEVFAHIIEDLGSMVAGAQVAPLEPFLERFDRLTLATARYLGSRHEVARLLLREYVDRGPFFSGPGRAAAKQVLNTSAAFMTEGMGLGVLARQDPRHLVMSICGAHLVYFATIEVSGDFLGFSIFDENRVEERAEAVRVQIRLLAGAAVDG